LERLVILGSGNAIGAAAFANQGLRASLLHIGHGHQQILRGVVQIDVAISIGAEVVPPVGLGALHGIHPLRENHLIQRAEPLLPGEVRVAVLLVVVRLGPIGAHLIVGVHPVRQAVRRGLRILRGELPDDEKVVEDLAVAGVREIVHREPRALG
jgi:hypothetical protein